ncbi:MAG TPA: hypothetical protein VIE69_09920 [Methylophilaceae bacterium]|jgi:uncharacterized membrane protein YqaE (UPF0057 family)
MLKPSKEKICAKCGYVGHAKKITKGSFLVEVILWLLFIPGLGYFSSGRIYSQGGLLYVMLFFIPGVIYSLWRITTKYYVCPNCDTPKHSS